ATGVFGEDIGFDAELLGGAAMENEHGPAREFQARELRRHGDHVFIGGDVCGIAVHFHDEPRAGHGEGLADAGPNHAALHDDRGGLVFLGLFGRDAAGLETTREGERERADDENKASWNRHGELPWKWTEAETQA